MNETRLRVLGAEHPDALGSAGPRNDVSETSEQLLLHVRGVPDRTSNYADDHGESAYSNKDSGKREALGT